MKPTHETLVQMGAQQVRVVTEVSGGTELETRLERDGMTTKQQRKTLTMHANGPEKNRAAAMAREAAREHVGTVQDLLSTSSDTDEGADVQTAKNVRSKAQAAPGFGTMRSFCLNDAPTPEELSQLGVNTHWTSTVRGAEAIVTQAQQVGMGLVQRAIVHGEKISAHIQTKEGGTRVCLVDVETKMEDRAIASVLESLKCER